MKLVQDPTRSLRPAAALQGVIVVTQVTKPKNSAGAMNKHQNTTKCIKSKFSLHVLLNKSLRFLYSAFSTSVFYFSYEISFLVTRHQLTQRSRFASHKASHQRDLIWVACALSRYLRPSLRVTVMTNEVYYVTTACLV